MRPREGPARLGLDFGRELLVLDLLVALERDAVDHRVFDHRDDDTAAGLVDLHVLEQAGRDQRLEAVVDRGLIETPAGTGPEIGADRLGLDAAIALDHDRLRRLARRPAAATARQGIELAIDTPLIDRRDQPGPQNRHSTPQEHLTALKRNSCGRGVALRLL